MAQRGSAPPLAVRLALAIVLAAGAIAFGIWATSISNPSLFGRLVNLAVVWTGVAAVLGLAGTVATLPKSDAKAAELAEPAKPVPAAPTSGQGESPAPDMSARRGGDDEAG